MDESTDIKYEDIPKRYLEELKEAKKQICYWFSESKFFEFLQEEQEDIENYLDIDIHAHFDKNNTKYYTINFVFPLLKNDFGNFINVYYIIVESESKKIIRDLSGTIYYFEDKFQLSSGMLNINTFRKIMTDVSMFFVYNYVSDMTDLIEEDEEIRNDNY